MRKLLNVAKTVLNNCNYLMKKLEKMKKIVLSLVLISVTGIVGAQVPNHHWTRTANGGSCC